MAYLDFGESFSEFGNVTSGVPQGSVLGPILFLLYVNNVVDCVDESVKMKIFADEIKLYMSFLTEGN